MKKGIGCTLMAWGLMSSGILHAASGADSDRGKALSATCVACHGSDGNSESSLFPKLAGLGQRYLLKQMEDIRSGARPIPEMTGMLEGFNRAELVDIAQYYTRQDLALSGAKSLEVQLNSGVKVDSLPVGERVYRAGNAETGVPACSGCHSPTGRGNAPAAYPRLGGQHADYIEKQLRQFRAGDRTNDGDAMVMREIAAHMSDAEISLGCQLHFGVALVGLGDNTLSNAMSFCTQAFVVMASA